MQVKQCVEKCTGIQVQRRRVRVWNSFPFQISFLSAHYLVIFLILKLASSTPSAFRQHLWTCFVPRKFFLFSTRLCTTVILICRCNTPTQIPHMILSYMFKPQQPESAPAEKDQKGGDFSFMAAGLASRQIHPLWAFVVSPPQEVCPGKAQFQPLVRSFRDSSVKGDFSYICVLSLVRFCRIAIVLTVLCMSSFLFELFFF